MVKVNKKLSAWEYKLLSMAGRLMLIKSVIFSLPIYLFHTINPTLYVIKRFDKAFNKFLLCYYKEGDSHTWRRICNNKWKAEPLIHWGIGQDNYYFW